VSIGGLLPVSSLIGDGTRSPFGYTKTFLDQAVPLPPRFTAFYIPREDGSTASRCSNFKRSFGIRSLTVTALTWAARGRNRRRCENGRASESAGVAEWACVGIGGRGGMGGASKSAGVAEWACVGIGGRCEMGVRRNRRALRKWACVGIGGRGGMGVSRNGRAWRNHEHQSACHSPLCCRSLETRPVQPV
jgi:hypothetical protein